MLLLASRWEVREVIKVLVRVGGNDFSHPRYGAIGPIVSAL